MAAIDTLLIVEVCSSRDYADDHAVFVEGFGEAVPGASGGSPGGYVSHEFGFALAVSTLLCDLVDANIDGSAPQVFGSLESCIVDGYAKVTEEDFLVPCATAVVFFIEPLNSDALAQFVDS